jgi:Mn2+/Fe2+ NRAMP family transporter
MPLNRQALIVVTGIVATTLAPWGLAFIQSYAADKRLTRTDLRFERVDVFSGAILTGIIGAFVRRLRSDVVRHRSPRHQRRA